MLQHHVAERTLTKTSSLILDVINMVHEVFGQQTNVWHRKLLERAETEDSMGSLRSQLLCWDIALAIVKIKPCLYAEIHHASLRHTTGTVGWARVSSWWFPNSGSSFVRRSNSPTPFHLNSETPFYLNCLFLALCKRLLWHTWSNVGAGSLHELKL